MESWKSVRWQVMLCAALSAGVVGLACDDEGGGDVTPDAAALMDAPVDGPSGSSTFGTLCTSNAQCTGAADYCLISPDRGPTGVCTRINCNLTPGVCPADWPCFNLNSLVMPGSPFENVMLPHVCLTPALLPPAPGKDAGVDAATDAANDAAPTVQTDAAADAVVAADADVNADAGNDDAE